MLLTAATGSENFQTGQAKQYLLYIPTPDLGGEETFLGAACKHPALTQKGFGLVGKPTIMSAGQGMGEEVGRWSMATYVVPDGALLKVFFNKNGDFGTMRTVANQFIRMRETAPLNRLTAQLTQHPKATFKKVCVEGRFDVLTLDEAIEAGAVVPDQFRASFDSVMAGRAWELTRIEGEIAPRPVAKTVTITNSKDEEIVVKVPSRRRALPF